jgi:hypothetical protein
MLQDNPKRVCSIAAKKAFLPSAKVAAQGLIGLGLPSIRQNCRLGEVCVA